MKTISVIIPAYNEEKSIIEVLRRVGAQKVDGFQFEVIVIDDGSKDRTRELLAQNPSLYTKLVAKDVNGGKGAAVLSGLASASGDFILFQDADLEYDPSEYAKLLEPITRFDADLVFGSRLLAPACTRVSYFWHRVGNRFITFAFNIVNNMTFTDIYSCYMLYRRDLVGAHELKTMGWEQHAEILSIAARRAKNIYEVPISYYGRTYAEGKKIKPHHAIAVLWTIFKKRLFVH